MKSEINGMGKGYYTTNGSIYNEKDEQVVLKGVSKTGLEYGYVDLAAMIPEMIDFDVKKMSDWGVNVVRLPLRDYYWITREEYRKKVEEIVEKILAKNWVVILDLHTQQQNPNMDNFLIRTDTGKDAKEMWSQLALRYKDTPSVFFEIFNEPHHITPDVWWKGDNQHYGYREILMEIRKTTDNICILGGLDYAFQWDFLNYNPSILTELLSFKNVVLSTHPYGYRGAPASNGTQTTPIPTDLLTTIDPKVYTGDCHLGITIPKAPYDEYGWNSSFGFLVEKKLFPVIATEWGLDRPDNCIQGGWFNVDMLRYLNSMNISYTAWAWVQDRLDYPSLLDAEFNPTGKGTRETFGPACSGPLNSFYPGPGGLVYMDLIKSSSHHTRLLESPIAPNITLLPPSNNHDRSGDGLECTRNFFLLIGCLFCFFNIFYWCPLLFQRNVAPPVKREEADETTRERTPRPYFHTGIRIRSSHSFGYMTRPS